MSGMEKLIHDAKKTWELRRAVRRLFELEEHLAAAEHGNYAKWRAAVEDLEAHRAHLQELVEVHA